MKAEQSKSITAPQIKKIHTMLNELGIMDEKRDIIYSISDGRTTSVKELTIGEARKMISQLINERDSSGKKRGVFRAIYGLAFEMDIIYGETDDDYLMNIAKLNMFCRERGTVKKNLTEQTYAEICKSLRQFEAMYKKFKNKKKRNETVCVE